MNRTGLIAKISIKYVLPTCIWKYFWRISRYFVFFWEFRGISRKYLNFAGPRPVEISEALIVAVSFLRIPFTIIWACMEASKRNKPSSGIKALPIFGPPANGNKNDTNKSRFCPNRNLTGTMYHWSVILRSFSVVLNSAKCDANGFFKVLLLSSHLLISRHPVQKSKFGACTVMGYCSFNRGLPEHCN